jgi:hypothetical protein
MRIALDPPTSKAIGRATQTHPTTCHEKSGSAVEANQENEMRRRIQEQAFVAEIRKRIFHLVDEFNLNAFFLIGALEMIVHEIKNDIDLFSVEEDEDDDNRDT